MLYFGWNVGGGDVVIRLFPDQLEAKVSVQRSWAQGAQNTLLVLPTGSGKTVIFSDIIHGNFASPSIAIAHRQELITQISLALARNGQRHRIIGPQAIASLCTSMHLTELKRNYVDPTNHCAVAGVDTLIRMPKEAWMDKVTLIVMDEAHHILKRNKWGKAMAMFPNARGLGVSATPCRADGFGLGRHHDGYMDDMVVGLGMRELIDMGRLCDYRIFAPPSDLDLRGVPITASGEFSQPKLANAVHRSTITGDIVGHYVKLAYGKLGITFCVDVQSAIEQAAAYRNAGVPAEVVTSNTPGPLRQQLLRRFRAKEIWNLVNVDLFSEGTDVPGVEVVSLGRPTESYGVFSQQFGRGLRVLEGKPYATIIDHVGNVHRHGLPDAYREWTLDRRDRKASSNIRHVIPTRSCVKCTAAYERFYISCPYCGHRPEPAGRSTPEQVEGDLYELSPEALAKMRGDIDSEIKFPYGATPEIIGALKKKHREKKEAQEALRVVMAQWGGIRAAKGDSIQEAQRRFYLQYGVDVGTAQALSKREADALRERIVL